MLPGRRQKDTPDRVVQAMDEAHAQSGPPHSPFRAREQAVLSTSEPNAGRGAGGRGAAAQRAFRGLKGDV